VLRQEHKAGEKLFVDWAGTTIPIYDPSDGSVQQAHLSVAVLGASSCTYAEATADEQLANWIGAHVHAFEFYQGVPKLVVPDNTKTGVTKGGPYDPDVNPTYQEMVMHYGVGVVPARLHKPRRDPCEICEHRYQVCSLISHVAVARDPVALADRRSTVADGILDRLVHNVHRIEMRGDSMRKNRGKPNTSCS
jgi:hypothetical protein